jgi:hypothetical protein
MDGEIERPAMPEGVDLDAVLTDLAVEWLRASMKSASTDVIDPRDWWERARTALVTAAATAETWPQMVARQLGKLQVTSTVEQTATAIRITGEQLSELGPAAWPRFRALCERDGLYIAAMAQALNAADRAERKGKKS